MCQACFDLLANIQYIYTYIHTYIQVGTFSLVKESTEVLGLLFARWVRSLAFLPKDKGTLFRSKAVLAVAGSDRKLVFHAVSDVMER